MHIHTVYFWLQDDLDKSDRAAFAEGLATLCADPTATQGYFGVPANANRDVVDNSYSYALVLLFQDTGKHDQYQVGAIHDRFLAAHAAKWTRVQVYDAITPETV